MGQRWFVSSGFFFFFVFRFSNSLYVDLLNSGNKNEIDFPGWNNENDQSNFRQKPPEYSWEDPEKPKNLIDQPGSEERKGNAKLLTVLTFDKLYNFTERDRGPKNETKVIFIKTEDHLKIFGNEDKGDAQLYEDEDKNISSEGLTSPIEHEDQNSKLERAKRQAENGGRRRCRCRRRGRRNMVRRRRRRRRRRNRVGQQRPARRRRRRGRRRNGRRGRRRCVCRQNGQGGGGEGEGKSDGDESDVEEADGDEEEETDGSDEATTEEAEEGDEGGEEEDDDEEEEEGDEEDGDDEEEESDDDEDSEAEGNEEEAPKEGMSSVATYPTYIIPYPNMVETPIAMMPPGGFPMGGVPPGAVPTGAIPPRVIPMYKFPPHTPSALRKRIPNTEVKGEN